MRKHNRRRFLQSTAITGASLGLTGCIGTGGGGDVTEFAIGHGIASEEAHWLMDANPDLLENWGDVYEAEFVEFGANNARLQAYQAGEIVGGQFPAITSLFIFDRGLPLRMVSGIAHELPDYFNEKFLVPSDSDMDLSADGLRGSQIGVCAYQSMCDLWAQAAVYEAGLTMGEDAEVVQVPFPSLGESVANGQVDTGVFPPTFWASATSQFDLKEAFDVTDVIGGPHTFLTMWFDNQWLEENEEVVRAYLEDFSIAAEHFMNNTEEAKRTLHDAGYVQTPLDQYLELPHTAYGTQILTDSIEYYNELAVDIGWLEEEVDLDLLIDTSYLPE